MSPRLAWLCAEAHRLAWRVTAMRVLLGTGIAVMVVALPVWAAQAMDYPPVLTLVPALALIGVPGVNMLLNTSVIVAHARHRVALRMYDEARAQRAGSGAVALSSERHRLTTINRGPFLLPEYHPGQTVGRTDRLSAKTARGYTQWDEALLKRPEFRFPRQYLVAQRVLMWAYRLSARTRCAVVVGVIALPIITMIANPVSASS